MVPAAGLFKKGQELPEHSCDKTITMKSTFDVLVMLSIVAFKKNWGI